MDWLFLPKICMLKPYPSLHVPVLKIRFYLTLKVRRLLKLNRIIHEALIQYSWCPYEREKKKKKPTRDLKSLSLPTLWGHNIHSHHLQAKMRTLFSIHLCWHLDLGFPSIQNCEKINFFCLSSPASGIFLRQSEQTETAHSVWEDWSLS